MVWFQLSVPSQCLEMIWNIKIYLCFIKAFQHIKGCSRNQWVSAAYHCDPSAHFTSNFISKLRYDKKIHNAVIQLFSIRPPHIFAHGMTAQLSCHMQIFVVTTFLVYGLKPNKICIKSELWHRNRLWDGWLCSSPTALEISPSCLLHVWMGYMSSWAGLLSRDWPGSEMDEALSAIYWL